MPREMPFDFEMPVTFFEKADADLGKKKRIGGIASLGTKDQQGETILQRGLDFSTFLSNGWFNDNHSKKTDGILGYPEGHQYFRKGQTLPDATVAPAEGHWVEGYLLDTPEADSIWRLGQALQKTNRRLGFSVEGKIQKRTGTNKEVIAKALVRNMAITNCPVHTGARMEILARSLDAIENTEPDEMEKTLGMGTPTPGVAPQGPKTGPEAGQVLTGESLEKEKKKVLEDEEKDKKPGLKKSVQYVLDRIPQATIDQALQVVLLTRRLKRAGGL